VESFTLDRLQSLCEEGKWREAEDEARDIAFICRHNDQVLNPPFYLRKPTPCRYSPSERIHGVLRRISRNRILERKEAYDLALRMARKWSGNSGNTMRAFSIPHIAVLGRAVLARRVSPRSYRPVRRPDGGCAKERLAMVRSAPP
jgi:hypothetical protein